MQHAKVNIPPFIFDNGHVQHASRDQQSKGYQTKSPHKSACTCTQSIGQPQLQPQMLRLEKLHFECHQPTGLFLDFSTLLLHTTTTYVHYIIMQFTQFYSKSAYYIPLLMQSGVKRPPLQSPAKQPQLRGPLLPTPEPSQFSRQSMFLILVSYLENCSVHNIHVFRRMVHSVSIYRNGNFFSYCTIYCI